MKKTLLYLLAILIVATILRVYQLDKVPPALFGDEVDVGYQAYSLLKTGKDLYGNSWPTLIHSLAEYRAPLFIYSAIPFIGIFGLNEWGVRLPAVFFGVLGVLGLFFLTRKLFGVKIGLLAAGFMSISPWHIQYSRAGFEVTMLLTFFVFATFFFLKGMEKKYYLIISVVLFGLTPYIYSTAVVFMPLLLIIMIIIFIKDIRIIQDKRITFAIAICVLVLLLLPYAWQTISGKSGERFSIVSVFGNEDLRDKVQLAQQQEQLPANFQRLLHNKWTEWGRQISMNYLRAYSPEFLFLNGDPNSRHSVHEMGQMYLFEIVLLGFGIFWVSERLKSGVNKKNIWLVIGWLSIAPVPAALTYDGGFHATRDFIMLPPLMILLALGTNYLMERIKNPKLKILGGIIIIIAAVNIIFYLHRYFVHYPTEQWKAWHFGFKEAMQYVKENENQYQNIYINNTYEPSLIRFLFWTKYDPAKFQQEFVIDQPRTIAAGFEGFTVGKYYFGKFTGPFEQIVDPLNLYVTSARDDITNPDILNNQGINLVKTIYSPTGEPIFYILSGE